MSIIPFVNTLNSNHFRQKSLNVPDSSIYQKNTVYSTQKN